MVNRASTQMTLYPIPPPDSTLAPIEHPLLVVPIRTEEEVDLFTHAYPLWHPPPGRGVFGGLLLSQALSAAQHTVSSCLVVHSVSCSFFTASDASQPIVYHVGRLSDGRSFASRLVQAKQSGRTVLTALCSFMVLVKVDARSMLHQSEMPKVDVSLSEDESDQTNDIKFTAEIIKPGFLSHASLKTTYADVDPFRWYNIQSPSNKSPPSNRMHMWARARGRLSRSRNAHLTALVFLTDSWFISGMSELNPSVVGPQGENIGFMASLNHTIWFHYPEVKADEWMLLERGSSWAGQERCLMEQRIWSKHGKLIVTCSQEGVFRLRRPQEGVEKIPEEHKSKL